MHAPHDAPAPRLLPRLPGMQGLGAVTVLPLATGMALTLVLLALRAQRPGAQWVVWSRIDQKTCLKVRG